MKLSTSYMGIPLRNPLIAGASSYTADVDTLKRIQDAGAGAVVLKSLFEEQLQLERFEFDDQRERYDDQSAEVSSFFPRVLEHGGPKGHEFWVHEAKRALAIPVIASINARTTETWVEYAKDLARTGVDGLELNMYTVPDSDTDDGATVEAEQIAAVAAVVSSVAIPVSVKMTSFYANPLNMASRFAAAGARGLVLFNRLLQPRINTEKERMDTRPYLSTPEEFRLPLRFTGALYGNADVDVCTSTGVSGGADIFAATLAGAAAVEAVSVLYRNGIPHIATMLNELESLMERKGYRDLESFRGKLSKKQIDDPWAYQRAQHINILWRANQIVKGSSLADQR